MLNLVLTIFFLFFHNSSFDDIIIGGNCFVNCVALMKLNFFSFSNILDVKEEDDDDEEDEEDDETSGERAYDQLAYCGGLLQMHLRSRAYLHQQYQRPSFQWTLGLFLLLFFVVWFCFIDLMLISLDEQIVTFVPKRKDTHKPFGNINVFVFVFR